MRNTIPFGRAGTALFVLLFLACTQSQATIISTFTSRASWEAATSGRTDITFDSLGLSPGGFTNYSNSTGLTIGSVTFTGFTINTSSYFLYALNPQSGWDENYGSGTLLKGPMWYQSGGVNSSYIQLVFLAGITSIGLDLATIGPRGANVRVSVDGTDLGSAISTSNSALSFIGFTADTSVTQVRIYVDSGTLYNTQALLDNISYGTATPPPGSQTPETATLLLVGGGLYGIAWRRRRLRLSAA
jgi:hypothetical protein